MVDVKLRSWASADDILLLMDSSATETWAWRKSRALRICGVRRDVRFFVVVAVLLLLSPFLLGGKEEEEEEEEGDEEGGKVEMGRRPGGLDCRCGVGKSS